MNNLERQSKPVQRTKFLMREFKNANIYILSCLLYFLRVIVLGRGRMSCICYSINIQHIDCYCIKGLWCCYAIVDLLIYFMMGLLMCRYGPFWQKVSVDSRILRWPLRPVALLINFLKLKQGAHGPHLSLNNPYI